MKKTWNQGKLGWPDCTDWLKGTFPQITTLVYQI